MSERRGDWIQTVTGRQFWPLDPRPEDFVREDIAHALAMKCRFNGHSLRFYSVAEHSVWVSMELIVRFPGRVDLAFWGLLHDLAEAYLPDVPRPVKRMGVGVLHESERLIMAAAAERYGLNPAEEPAEVKAADSALLADEAMQVMSRPPSDWYLPEPPTGMKILCLSPSDAKELFLAEWESFDLRRGVRR